MTNNLLEPKEYINYFIRVWRKDNCEINNRVIIMFDKAKLKPEVLKNNELTIDHSFNELIKNPSKENTLLCVVLLDSIYHTQIKYIDEFSFNLYNNEIKNQLITDIISCKSNNTKKIRNCIDRIVSVTTTKSQSKNYSFATKFCNRLNPKVFPIFDSYVASLLLEYDKNLILEELKYIKNFGDYGKYINAYNRFINKYSLEKYDFKEIDEFMWTYAKYLVEEKIIKKKEGIQYIKKDEQ